MTRPRFPWWLVLGLWLAVCAAAQAAPPPADPAPTAVLHPRSPSMAAGVLHLLVVDHEGRQISAAQVALSPQGQTARWVGHTASAGRLAIPGLARGRYEATFTREGFDDVHVRDILAGTGARNLTVVMVPRRDERCDLSPSPRRLRWPKWLRR